MTSCHVVWRHVMMGDVTSFGATSFNFKLFVVCLQKEAEESKWSYLKTNCDRNTNFNGV